MRRLAQRAVTAVARPILWLKDHPVVWRGRRTTLVGYGLFAAANALAVITLATFYVHLKGGAVALLVPFLPLMALGVWLGSKAMHLAALGKKLSRNPAKYLSETGFYVQGGILGALAAAYVIGNWGGLDPLLFWDGLAWGGTLGLVFGRLGCFNYGCCYGRPTSLPWGVSYCHHETKVLRLHPRLAGVRLHPTQLYVAASHLVAFGLFTWLVGRGLPNGLLTGAFLVYHGVSRIVLERFRGDVFFYEGRNWTTFVVAWSMVVAGLASPWWGPWAFGSFGSTLAFTEPLSWRAAWSFLALQEALVPSLFALAVVVVAGFGVHGTQLGTFPWATPARDEGVEGRYEVRALPR
jgi:prolipoprotein diacylglyceryltransferase